MTMVVAQPPLPLLNYPYGIAVSPDGLTVYICEGPHSVRKITGGIAPVPGSHVSGSS